LVQVIGTRRIFQGRIIGVRVDDVIYPNGNRAEVEIVEHNGGVCIAAQPDPASIVLVRQYRPAIGRELWEVPAGKLDGDEAPAAAARRELIEETGYRCSTLEQVRTFYSAPGFCGELLYLFSAGGLTAGAPQPAGAGLYCRFARLDFYCLAATVRARTESRRVHLGLLEAA